MNFARWFGAHQALKWGFLLGSFLLVGCASSPQAVHNDREGFFDRMAKWTPAHQSNPGNPLVHMVSSNIGEKAPASRTSKKTFLEKISKAAGIEEADASSTIAPKGQAAGTRGIGNSNGPITAAGIEKIRSLSLRWPLDNVEVTSPFGQRKHEFHEGIDLRAKKGTSVYSAHAGQVLYAGDRISGYGKMVVIRHSSGIATVYAHNSKLLVRKGQWVSQGTRIAISGSTGHSTGPHLHFEVRAGVAAINPLEVLPKTKARMIAANR